MEIAAIVLVVFVVFVGLFFLPAPMVYLLRRWDEWWDRQTGG